MSTDQSTERRVADLMAGVAEGDRHSFETLYDLTAPLFYAVCVRVLGAGADAEEGLQEAFVKVWRHADQWPGTSGSALPWLLAIARHTAIDRRRARSRRSTHMEGLAREGHVLPIATPAAFATPEEAASFASDKHALLACLDSLPQDRADVVRSAYFSGDTYADIAKETGRPEGTLKSWVHRSLSALRDCLEGRGVGGLS